MTVLLEDLSVVRAALIADKIVTRASSGTHTSPLPRHRPIARMYKETSHQRGTLLLDPFICTFH